MIRGGYNVYPREIEEVLYEHPAVARGRRRSASRTTSSARRSAPPSRSRTAPTATAAELRAFVKERVAAYKYPRHGLARRRAPEGADGQDPQARDQAPAV